MNIPLWFPSLASLVLEVPNYYQSQRFIQHLHPHQPLTTHVSPSKSSIPILPRRVHLCHTRQSNRRPQRRPLSQTSRKLSTEVPHNKVKVKAEGEGEETLLEVNFNWRRWPRPSPITSPTSPATALDAQQQTNAPIDSTPQQPEHPSVATPVPAVVTSHRRQPSGTRRNLQAARPPGPYDFAPQSPFRNRAAADPATTSFYRLPRRFGPGRLWNPTNSTPRVPPQTPRAPRPAQSSRRRRLSTPPPPAVPVNHPTIEVSSDPPEPIGGFGAGDFPLLPLPEHSARGSVHIEGRVSGDRRRISLPASIRHSYDSKRFSNPPPPQEAEAGPSEPRPKPEKPIITGLRRRGQSVTKRARAISFGLVRVETSDNSPRKSDKGKGKAVMSPDMGNDDPTRSFSKDLERGPSALGNQHNGSNLSLPGGIGSAISSSNSSIMGDPDQPDIGEEWGPQHPCYPHLNPHVPMNSLEYTNTRIIRIRRDWLIEGDLAPTFSNLYPEILDPAGISEQEFRRVIEKLNGELVPIFNPYNWRNILDGILGLLTGWIWDDLGLTYAKTRLRNLEDWIDKWNTEMEKTAGSDENVIPPRIVPLRRTGYMNLDFQIPDPEIAPATNSEPSGSRSGPNMPSEPKPVVLPDSPIAA
ncbi:Golgin subfamily A member 7/ERF4 family-domain-containing protein [Hypoxylon trugodes]|uniref:Golgin subfamily A member 7/ERF4 family-domain-containing protein n=1 Tax=Hypoxylon trugodes TaxID=326681 RepID=UPI00219C69BF|nr:Golgin subfamily A member 7/ERF4 family-domain-containing protein [Hypoxylon trugodes]KAI1393636.1 Golgin subfamily A member 7/ERF4 family-domain-containing protein [Hypoxylon trugodes]